MRRFLSHLLGWTVLLLIVLVVIAFIGWSRVPDMLANNMSKKMHVTVSIGDIGLSWKEISISNAEIGNVKGGILPKAFSAEQIYVNAPLSNYLDKVIVIDQIAVNDIYLGLEFDSAKSTNGNWTTIMKNLKSSTAVKEKESSSGKIVFIRSLLLTNISVDVVYIKEGGKVQKLPPIKSIELKNISTEKGIPMDQLMNSVLGQMLQSVFIKQNLQNMLQDIIQNQSDIQKFLSPFKGFFNANPTDPKIEIAISE